MKKRSPVRLWGIFLSTVIVLVLLSACSLPKIGGFAGIGGQETPSPETTVVASQETSSPEAPGAEEAAPGTPASSQGPGSELSAADFAEGAGGIHGMIVFQSAADQPFARLSVAAADLPYAERHLFAFSPDGAQAGRISPPGFGAGILLAQRPGLNPSLVQYGLEIANDAVDVTRAPEMCGLDNQRAFDPQDPPCGGFQFSPDRGFLAYYTGPDSCGRTLQVLDLQTGNITRSFDGVRWAYFQKNSTLMLASGDCETVKSGLFIPHQNTYAGTGVDGMPTWNPRHTAVIYQVAAHFGARQALWGFNLENSKVILWMEDEDVLQDQPNWTPDGETFLFQHRRVHYDPTSQVLVTEGPRQIVRMNANTRTQQLLASGGKYDYHLCVQDGAPCDQWYGDYVQVRRTLYRPAALQFDADSGQYVDGDAARCALSGLDCAEPDELFALNWKTGELIPWDEAGLYDAGPALPAAPNLDSAAIYEDPNGAFAYYVGLDGRSLWRINTGGDPELWVQEGQDFLYLP